MKQCILPFLLVLSSISSYSQKIPKYSNTIIVKGITYVQLCDSLLRQGYFIDKQDTASNLVITKPTLIKSGASIKLFITIKDSSAYIQGTVNSNINYNLSSVTQNSQDEQISNHGMFGSLYASSFNRMNDFAQSLKRNTVYLKIDKDTAAKGN